MEEDAKEIEYEMLYKGPIKDKTIWINCPAVFAFVFVCIAEIAAIVVSIVFAEGIQLKLLISLVLIFQYQSREYFYMDAVRGVFFLKIRLLIF